MTQNQTNSMPAPVGETVAFQYKLEADDLIAGNMIMSKIDPTVRGAVQATRYYLPALFILVAVGCYWVDGVLSVVFGCGAVFVLISGARFSRTAVTKRIKREIESGGHKDLGLINTLTITPTGFTSGNSESEGKFRWERIARVIESGDCLFVYTSKRFAIVVPRGCVLADRFDDLVATIEKYVPVQRIKAGETYKEARHAEIRHRDRKRRRRGLRAFAEGALYGLAISPVCYMAAEEFLPTLTNPIQYAMTIAMVPIAVASAVSAARATQQSNIDYETRCRRCQYILKSLTEPRCPECGERI